MGIRQCLIIIGRYREFHHRNPDGYYGVAYINTTTHEVVIANRGTIWTSLANLINDAELAAHEVTPMS